ncbi:MAG: DUF4249 domain-containing protein [Bacteroidales bacterium]|nr:DUF4249 domain-containing protein [Bacteroidales bacterium]
MRVIRLTVYIVASLLFTSCVERYYPGADDVFTGTLVINAHLTSTPGEQTIQISRSDGLLYPEFIPESSCVVEVESEAGKVVSFSESKPGYYTGDIPSDFMSVGERYMLRVVTSDGNIYISDYSELHMPSAISAIYYERELFPTNDPEITIDGIRFYMDFEIDSDASEFMRWELIETYEFHNPDYPGFIYSFDRILKPIPDSLSDRQCWITGHVHDIYTLDAANMSNKNYTYMPLHFVSNETQRLSYGYSLLVRQHAVDAPAFRYWDELKKNAHTQSGLYDRLPSMTPGNISNVDDPTERILGFFGVSGVTEKRVFVKDVEGLDKYDILFCYPYPEPPRFRFLMTADLPVYCSRASNPEVGDPRFGETVHECLDCRVRKGSSGDPPDFWPID